MATVDLKRSVQDYVDSADDRLLKMIKALAETYWEGEAEYEITSELKAVLDDRFESYKENPNDLLDWDDVKENW